MLFEMLVFGLRQIGIWLSVRVPYRFQESILLSVGRIVVYCQSSTQLSILMPDQGCCDANVSTICIERLC